MKAMFFALLAALLMPGPGAAQAPQVHIRRTYYDEDSRHLHEEYQYVSTPANRYCKQGYYKEYNEDGTLWRKQLFRDNRNEGRQLEYETTDGQTWVKYDMLVRGNLLNGPYIRYSGPGEKMAAGNYVNGEQAGRWTFYYSDTYEVCTYENNEKEGPATLYWRSGKVADHYVYREGEKRNIENGDYRAVNEDGTPWKSGHFTDGEMNGEFRAWYPNGQLRYIERYVMGRREGRILTFSANGDTLADDGYEHDVLVRHRKSAQEAAREQEEASEQAQRQRRDSLRVAAEQQRIRTEKAEALARQQLETAQQLLATAQAKQEALARLAVSHSALGSGNDVVSGLIVMGFSAAQRKPQKKLYTDLYAKLRADYEAATAPADKLAKAQRLLALLDLTEALYKGEQPEKDKTIRKESDLDKVLTITGI